MKIYVLIAAFCVALPFLYLFLKVAIKNKAQYKPKNLLTDNELEFFWRLTRALPEVFIFPQVAMSALIDPTATQGTKAFMSSFGRISQKRVDYALYDTGMKLLCVVELDDKTHQASKDEARDRLLKSAGIRTIRWNSKNKPQASEIQDQVFQPSQLAA
jgi:hypothetical protein